MKILLHFSLFCLFVNTVFAQNTDFAVEVGAFDEKVDLSYFKMNGVYETFDINEIYRYQIAAKTKEEAETIRKKAINAGYVYARVIDFKYLEEVCSSACGYTPPKRTSSRTSRYNDGNSPNNSNSRNTPDPNDGNTGNVDSNPNSRIGNPVSNSNKNDGKPDPVVVAERKIVLEDNNSKEAKELRKNLRVTYADLLKYREQGFDGMKPSELFNGNGEIQCIFFDYNKSILRKAAKQELSKVANWTKTHPEHFVFILAHTDSRGKEKYNTNLSQERAEEAVKYLEQKNVDPDHIAYLVYGEQMPIAKNETETGTDSEEGRQFNRRIELILINEEGKPVGIVQKIYVPEHLRVDEN